MLCKLTFLFFIFIFFLCHKRTGNSTKVPRLMPTEGVWRRVFVVKMSGPYSLVGIPGKGRWWQSLMAKTSLLMDEWGGQVNTRWGHQHHWVKVPGVWVEVAWGWSAVGSATSTSPLPVPCLWQGRGKQQSSPRLGQGDGLLLSLHGLGGMVQGEVKIRSLFLLVHGLNRVLPLHREGTATVCCCPCLC